MIISFDLDNLIIPLNQNGFPLEKRSYFQKIIGVEPVRKGVIQLFSELKSLGHTVGIYTTSYRNPYKVKLNFQSYGVKLDFVINEYINRKELEKRSLSCSKYPPAFGIDLHIDDSEGVRIEGETFDFATIIIHEDDLNWIENVIRKLLKDFHKQ